MSEWTEDRVALLKELNTQGTNSWIAAELNARTGSSFTRNSVIGKLLRISVKKTIIPGCYSRPGKRGSYKKRGTLLALKKNPPAMPEHLGLALTELKDNLSQCRFIKGDNEATPYTFCAQPVEEGSSYCPYHQALCHDLPRKPQDRKLAA